MCIHYIGEISGDALISKQHWDTKDLIVYSFVMYIHYVGKIRFEGTKIRVWILETVKLTMDPCIRKWLKRCRWPIRHLASSPSDLSQDTPFSFVPALGCLIESRGNPGPDWASMTSVLALAGDYVTSTTLVKIANQTGPLSALTRLTNIGN
ncbi:hypothetical protein BDN72DRAFT_855981 [Pluteus cervinus]|uniref:Uncharacterized protein n=1 Tax=Pluteus cervinus TaxID=181527 RepID=A0ACD3B1B3_9AGAR|nr:hypothetical protein BDN72DRAFT_855981 [Pluteus cervinus]